MITIQEQVCIPVGCVPPACWPYLEESLLSKWVLSAHAIVGRQTPPPPPPVNKTTSENNFRSTLRMRAVITKWSAESQQQVWPDRNCGSRQSCLVSSIFNEIFSTSRETRLFWSRSSKSQHKNDAECPHQNPQSESITTRSYLLGQRKSYPLRRTSWKSSHLHHMKCMKKRYIFAWEEMFQNTLKVLSFIDWIYTHWYCNVIVISKCTSVS